MGWGGEELTGVKWGRYSGVEEGQREVRWGGL